MVGKNIKRYREEKQITQECLAKKLNVTRQAVSNWENSKTQPDIDMLNSIAQHLEVTIEELVYGEKREVKVIDNTTIRQNAGRGITFGMALAMIISYVNWQSIGWAILHGLLNWIYIIYYIFKYGWS